MCRCIRSQGKLKPHRQLKINCSWIIHSGIFKYIVFLFINILFDLNGISHIIQEIYQQKTPQMIQKSKLNRRILGCKSSVSGKLIADDQSLLLCIDKSLKHFNQISEANMVAQQLYIQLLKEKKTMKYDQIRKIYKTLTEGKAKQVLFERDKKQLVSTDYRSHECLGRVCWRSIQKLIRKITYYMVNEKHLCVISRNILKLIHSNQQFVRRFKKLKDSSILFIVQIIERLIEQNSILQKQIYNLLLNRGYVVSLDQFYMLNGYDAQHRQLYDAKVQPQRQQSLSSDSNSQQEMPSIQILIKTQGGNQGKNTRRKRGLRFDCRYSWRQKLQPKQDRQKHTANKTNYQIRQSFQKFIEDFLQNQNLNQILTNYNQQQEKDKQQGEQLPKRMDEKPNADFMIHKKIFQSKIQSVLNQLKSQNLKINLKLLEVIDSTSTQAITNCINLGQKKYSQRKNSLRRQSGEIITQRKLRNSGIINDRKIINQNFFREMLRRNTKAQQFIEQQIQNATQKTKDRIQLFKDAKVNANAMESTKNQPDADSRNRTSKLSLVKKGKAVFLFDKKQGKQNSLEGNTSLKTNKAGYRCLQKQNNYMYNVQSKNSINVKQNEYVTQMIRIIKQEQYYKNESSISLDVQNVTTNVGNLTKTSQVYKLENSKKNLQLFTRTNNTDTQVIAGYKYKNKRPNFRRIKTQMEQRHNQLNFNDITFQPIHKTTTSSSKARSTNRIRTQQNSTRAKRAKPQLQGQMSNNKVYQIYDCRLRRFIRK